MVFIQAQLHELMATKGYAKTMLYLSGLRSARFITEVEICRGRFEYVELTQM